MFQLLMRNITKRFLSWKTLVLVLISIGTMLTCYQHIAGRMGAQMGTLAYLILEGPFAVFMQVVSPENSMLISSILMAVMILCFVESPVVNQDDRFFIMRTGKTEWITAEMLGILCASALWIVLINIMGCVASFNNMDWTDWHVYPQNVKCMLVYLLAYVCIGLFILLFHLLDIKALGTAVMVTLFLLEKFILNVLPNNISVVSQDADTEKILTIIRRFTFMNRMENGYSGEKFVFSVVYFLVIIGVLVGMNMIYARKHEIG